MARRPWRLAAAVGLAALAVSAAAGSAAGSGADDPENRRPPRVEGTAQVGSVLAAQRGSWRRERQLEFAFQWRTCDAATAECTDVKGATDRVYPVRAADVGRAISVAVTATNADDDTTVASRPTRPVVAAPEGSPAPTERPAITGALEVGKPLEASAGEWSGTEPVALRVEWRRCDLEGGGCEALPRVRDGYTVRERDEGHSFRVLVRARNAAGVGAALSEPTKAVPVSQVEGELENTTPPVISGKAMQGKALATSTGTWKGKSPIAFSFAWLRCNRAGDDCSAISGADDQTYKLARADVGRTLRAQVRARNELGSRTRLSDHTDVVAGLEAPVNSVRPKLSGTARAGLVLTVSSGTWKGDKPIRLAYRWLRCNARGDACSGISGADGRTRKLGSNDVGHTLRVRVSATNDGGASEVVTGASAVVAQTGEAPANRGVPVLSGAAQQGATLSLTNGSWSGSGPLTFGYAWVRCSATVSDCKRIENATGRTYLVTRADVGKRLYGVVTARNSAGTASAPSNATAVVVGAPVNTAPPSISGTAVEGRQLTAAPGSWSGPGPIAFGYQWTRCNADRTFASCRPIVVTASPTYILRAADVGKRVFVQVKAFNRLGATYVNSQMTEVVAVAPVGTVTLYASRSIVVYRTKVVLSGRAIGARPGERVTIVERPTNGDARARSITAVVSQSGTWTVVVRPRIRTVYEARVRDRTSVRVTVRVRPRLELRRRGPGIVSVKVTTARSLGGRKAILQRWKPKQRRWVNVRSFTLRAGRGGQPQTAVTVATVRTRLPRGTLVRVVVPSRQAGAGYLTATSKRVRA